MPELRTLIDHEGFAQTAQTLRTAQAKADELEAEWDAARDHLGKLQASLDPDDVDLLDAAERDALRAKRRLELQREQVKNAQRDHRRERDLASRLLSDSWRQADAEALVEIEQAAQHVVDLVDARNSLRSEQSRATGERLSIPSDGSIALAMNLRLWLQHRKPKEKNARIEQQRQAAERRSDRQHRARQAQAWQPGRRSRKPVKN